MQVAEPEVLGIMQKIMIEKVKEDNLYNSYVEPFTSINLSTQLQQIKETKLKLCLSGPPATNGAVGTSYGVLRARICQILTRGLA